MSYDHFKSEANKLNKLHLQYDNMQIKFAELNAKKKNFYSTIATRESKFTWMGMLCLAALGFDFIINSATLHWMPEMLGVNIPVQVFALIFLIIDAVIAALQAGAFENDAIEKAKAKRKWRAILWTLAGLKSALFIIFTHIVKVGEFEGTIVMTVIQIAFLILIYAILDKAGEGVYYLVQWTKFKMMEEILYVKPEVISNQANKIYSAIESKCPQFNLNYDEFLRYFGLQGKINNVKMEY